MKTILVGSLLLVAVSGSVFVRSSCKPDSAHDLKSGCEDGDTSNLLMRKEVSMPPKWLSVEVLRLTFPEPGVSKEEISCVLVRNLQSCCPGCVNLLKGGATFMEVTVEFTSQRGCGMKFRVEVYGKSKAAALAGEPDDEPKEEP